MTAEGGGDTSGQGGGGVTPPAEGGEPAAAPSSLPSDIAAGDVNLDGFQITDDLKEKFKDGKLNGRFSNINEVLDTLKNIEDKYSDLNRTLTDKEKADLANVQQTADEVATQQKQQALIEKFAPEFSKNGMVVTPEMATELAEAGLTEEQVKLGAYEFKEALTKNHNYVGGEENYNIIMEHHSANLTTEQKIQFNHSIQNPNNSEALMVGLQAMYERDMANGGNKEAPKDRFRGDVIPTPSIVGYESKQELFKDKKYIDSPVGKKDKGAVAKYRARLNATDPKVYS